MPETTWLDELSSWIYVVLIGGWLIQRWARKFLNRKQRTLVALQARWPSFERTELEAYMSVHGGNAEAACASIQQKVLSGELQSLRSVEMIKETASTPLGCMMAGMAGHLPSVSDIVPGSLAAASLRIGDTICRVNGEPALGVQTAQRLLQRATGVVRLQVFRRQSPAASDGEHSAGAELTLKAGAGPRQRVAPRLGGYGKVMLHPIDWKNAATNGDVASLRQQLLDRQPINQQNVCGITALHFAAEYPDAVEFLLSMGADATLRSNPGEAHPNMTAREISQVRQVTHISPNGKPLAYSKPDQRAVEMLLAAEAAQAGSSS